MSNDENKRGLGMPVEVARQQLMDSDDIQKLAEIFGVTLDEYVDLVLDYAVHPDKQPMLEVIDDEEELEGRGLPTQADVHKWLGDVESGAVDLSPQPLFTDKVTADFEVEKRKKSAGVDTTLAAPDVSAKQREIVVDQANPMGSILKDQLMNQRTRTHMNAADSRKKKKPSPSRPR